MKSNQTLQIVESVSWREESENQGENKYKKWENSTDRYEYIVLNIWKTCYFTLLKLLVTLSSPRSVIKSTFSEAAAEVFCKKGVLKFLQILQENNCVGVSFK